MARSHRVTKRRRRATKKRARPVWLLALSIGPLLLGAAGLGQGCGGESPPGVDVDAGHCPYDAGCGDAASDAACGTDGGPDCTDGGTPDGGEGGGGGGAPSCATVSGGEPITDEAMDFIDSDPGNVPPSFTCDCIDIVESSAERTQCDAGLVDALFNGTGADYGCSATDPMTVCSSMTAPMPAGEVLVFMSRFVAPVPLADMGHSFIYSMVSDTDGLDANDWKFISPYYWDLFQGADRWYQLIWNHKTKAWNLRVTQVNDQQMTADVPSSARAAIQGDTITFFVSAAEVPGPGASYRMTAFGHDGAFSASDRGADVDGPYPTMQLTPVP